MKHALSISIRGLACNSSRIANLRCVISSQCTQNNRENKKFKLKICGVAPPPHSNTYTYIHIDILHIAFITHNNNIIATSNTLFSKTFNIFQFIIWARIGIHHVRVTSSYYYSLERRTYPYNYCKHNTLYIAIGRRWRSNTCTSSIG